MRSDSPPSPPPRSPRSSAAFETLRLVSEIEIRSLSGESWTVVPDGPRVSDLRLAIGRGTDSTLFAHGERLEDENMTLPSPPSGERLVVHIAPSQVEMCAEWSDLSSPDEVLAAMIDAAESPTRSESTSPTPTAAPARVGSRVRSRAAWGSILLAVLVAAAVAIGGGRQAVPPPEMFRKVPLRRLKVTVA